MRKHHSFRSSGRQAFSLLELMIVIILISLVYSLVFSSMQKKEKEPAALEAKNLKSTLLDNGLTHTEAEFFCLDKCSQCFLYSNGETNKYEGKLALGELAVYRMGRNNRLEKEDFGRYEDHPVCLRFKLHSNGSSSQMVIKNKTGVYYLPALFGESLKTASLEDAESLWLKYSDTMGDSGGYY